MLYHASHPHATLTASSSCARSELFQRPLRIPGGTTVAGACAPAPSAAGSAAAVPVIATRAMENGGHCPVSAAVYRSAAEKGVDASTAVYQVYR